MAPLPPESHYDPKKLDKLFAIITLVLLASLIGIFAKDYSREWKDYQRSFHALEVEKTRVKIDAQDNALAKNEEYQAILKSLDEAKAKLKGQSKLLVALKDQIASLEAVKRRHTKYSQDSKAEYGALKYRYEAAAHNKSPKAPQLKIDLDTLDAKIEQLRLKIEADNKQLDAKNSELKGIDQEYRDIDKKRSAIAKKKEILERKLKRIDLQEMSAANQLADMVRNLPMIDLANPDYKIRQIVLKDIPEDVNFMKVPRVDRCTSCHLGIDNPDYKEAPQPFTTHPNLELFIGKDSAHPLEEFGCTTCHQGRGRGTDFISSVHTPRDAQQKFEWKQKYQWKEMEHWEQPMLPGAHVQASCFKCHQDQEVLKGAEQLNLGLALVERSGCYGCHVITKYKDWPKTGPTLKFLSAKTTKGWAYHWIKDPQSIRPGTWMPSYFHQSNNSDSAMLNRDQQGVLSIVEYLFGNSKPFDAKPSDLSGDVKKGKELVSSLGCFGCHQLEASKNKGAHTLDSLHREFGPSLAGLGSKTSKEWLINWLKDPARYHATTRMPDLRLSDQEAADIAEYLAQDKSPATDKPVPAVDEKVLNAIVLDFLKKSTSVEQSQEKLKSMDRQAKMEFAGKKLIREYGCFGCHEIPGFENEKPIGTELTEEGSKSLERLDFGFTHIEHTKEAWFEQKLVEPRIFDKGRTLQPLEKAKMPNFNFSDEDAKAVTTALLGFVKDRPDSAKMANKGVKAAFVNQGQKTIRQLNCQGCHVIEGDGGSIQPKVTEWLVDYEGKDLNDAKTVTQSFSPPNLIGEGAKVQPQWLFEFLNSPSLIRPWLHVRMPTYSFHGGQINSIIKYFNYLDDQEFPFTDIYHPHLNKEEFTAAEKLFSKEYFDCAKCHIVGDKMPGGTADNWAPDFNIAAKRLKPQWIVQWITNPADLLPGTKMPTYFDPKSFSESGPPDILNGDEQEQIKALRDYLLTISANAQEHPPIPAKTEEPAVLPNPAAGQ